MPISAFEILALLGLGAAVAIIVYLCVTREPSENAILAASLSAGFGAFTAVTIWAEGIMPVVSNHTTNLWGVQVWYDLLISVTIAVVFVVPRARKMDMTVPLWIVCVGATAGIGLLAMVARLFWLERQRGAATLQQSNMKP